MKIALTVTSPNINADIDTRFGHCVTALAAITRLRVGQLLPINGVNRDESTIMDDMGK